jgi:hypothetical protein
VRPHTGRFVCCATSRPCSSSPDDLTRLSLSSRPGTGKPIISRGHPPACSTICRTQDIILSTSSLARDPFQGSRQNGGTPAEKPVATACDRNSNAVQDQNWLACTSNAPPETWLIADPIGAWLEDHRLWVWVDPGFSPVSAAESTAATTPTRRSRGSLRRDILEIQGHGTDTADHISRVDSPLRRQFAACMTYKTAHHHTVVWTGLDSVPTEAPPCPSSLLWPLGC